MTRWSAVLAAATMATLMGLNCTIGQQEDDGLDCILICDKSTGTFEASLSIESGAEPQEAEKHGDRT
jgi:hypothetical protein